MKAAAGNTAPKRVTASLSKSQGMKLGETIEFDNVLLVSDDTQIAVGAPYLPGAMIKATVLDQFRGKKILIWKYRPKKRYRRRAGHRQSYTRLRIDSILFDDRSVPTAVEEEE